MTRAESDLFAAIVAALSQPSAYPGRLSEVAVIETHISFVFLAGARAYKVKKPVATDFLDFSTRERREWFCRQEVELNAALASGVYRGVVPIRRRDGSLHLGGAGEIVEHAVEMERLPGNLMLDVLLDRGHLDNAMLRDLAARLVSFHAHARRGSEVDACASPAAVRALLEANFAATDDLAGEGPTHPVTSDVHDLVEAWALHFLHEHEETLAARVRDGRACDGHGDLHAGNICFRDVREGGLVIYDRLEFDPRLRCGDVGLDLAFLLMDLDRRAWRGASDFLLREYVTRSGDVGLVDVIDVYKAYRAWVRGKVAALRAAQTRGEARARARADAVGYFNLAAGYAVPPSLVLLCGLPGCGKSTVAAALAPNLECVVVNSDHVRKRLAGVPPGESRRAAPDAGIYCAEMTEATYRTMLAEARDVLHRGRSVIVDAGFRRIDQRIPFLELAAAWKVPCLVVHVSPDPDVVRARVAARLAAGGSESDADLEVLAREIEAFEPPHVGEGAPVFTTTTRELPEETAMAVLGRLLRGSELSV